MEIRQKMHKKSIRSLFFTIFYNPLQYWAMLTALIFLLLPVDISAEIFLPVQHSRYKTPYVQVIMGDLIDVPTKMYISFDKKTNELTCTYPETDQNQNLPISQSL
jgi:hypothetical protein